MLRKLKSLGFSANLSYALGFLSVIGSIVIWFTQGGTDVEEARLTQESQNLNDIVQINWKSVVHER